MSGGYFSGEIFQQNIGSETRVFSMTWLEGTYQSFTGIKPQCARFAKPFDFYRWPHTHGFTVGMLCGVLLEPVLFQSNEIELIASRKLAVEPILIHEIAETPIASSPLDEFVIPRLRKIAQLRGRDVADVNLMGRVGRGRTKASKLVF